MNRPFISIVIPAYNEETYIGHCLEHVMREVAASGTSAEVIVIDNASTDRTGEVAHGFPGVTVVREPAKGLTKARQCGLEAARGDVLAFADADTRMPPGWLTQVAERFGEDKTLVCFSGPYTFYDLSFLERHLAWLYWLVLVWPTYLFTGFMAVGGNFAARKEALVQIGGFDTSIAFYGEDANIARRLHAAGQSGFSMRLYMPTSARRLKAEGIFTTAFRYAGNFLSEAFLKKPATMSYRDIR